MRILICSSMLSMLALTGCGTAQLFKAIPDGIDTTQVPHQTIDMTAEHFHFTPEEVHVKAGTLVTIRVTAIDGTHGFALGAFGLDKTIEEGETKTFEFYAGQKGKYDFRCSHFCGIGHLGMNGEIVVE